MSDLKLPLRHVGSAIVDSENHSICSNGNSKFGHREHLRRIAACVNACAGIPTELVEQGGFAAIPVSTHREVKQQRNELLTAVKELVSLAELGDADQDAQNWHPALESARAAIAKAEAV